ncbi:MAG: NAD(P)/FAD-dependent oxidoreductase [Burkholderiaceae bacterium]
MSTSRPPIEPVIVGAGPAGIRAAQTLVQAGLRPVVLDESLRAGGQIYRQPPAGFTRSKQALYGTEHKKADALHRTMDALAARVDYRAGALVWNADQAHLEVIQNGAMTSVPYTHLILATGATDRVLPFQGWTTPGVYTLGGSQVALKYQGCGIGSRVVFMGTGPLLYLVAYQYKKAGADVAAVLDTSTHADGVAGLAGMLRAPSLLAKGLYYMGWLRAHGVPLHKNVRPVSVQGGAQVSALNYRFRGQDTVHSIACDAVGYGLGLRSETQLASLLGCVFDFNSQDRAWLPRRDAAGRTSVSGIYVAGDGAGIAGADAAELAGERAALALLADAQLPSDARRAALLDDRLLANARVRTALERAFPFPADWAADLDDAVLLCRCEEITAGTVRQAAHDLGTHEMNRLKALTRVGMGRCQGRMCAAGATEVLAHALHQRCDAVGRIRSQPPVKPIPISVVRADHHEVPL